MNLSDQFLLVLDGVTVACTILNIWIFAKNWRRRFPKDLEKGER